MRNATYVAMSLIWLGLSSTSGCGSLSHMLGKGKGRGGKEKNAARVWRIFNDYWKDAQQRSVPLPSDADAWTKAADRWGRTCEFSIRFNSSSKKPCQHIGKCDEGWAAWKKAFAQWSNFVGQSVERASKDGTLLDIVGRAAVTIQRPRRSAKTIPIEGWIQKLATARRAQWKAKMRKHGDLRALVSRGAEGLCLAASKASAGVADRSSLAFAFRRDDTIYLRCVLPRALTAYTRRGSDYLNVTVYGGDDYAPSKRWKAIKLSKDAAAPSATDTQTFVLPAELIASHFWKYAKVIHADMGGPWLLIRVSYVVPKDTGKVREVWRDRRRYFEKVVHYSAEASGTFFVKVK